jgi:hypothetical protein
MIARTQVSPQTAIHDRVAHKPEVDVGIEGLLGRGPKWEISTLRPVTIDKKVDTLVLQMLECVVMAAEINIHAITEEERKKVGFQIRGVAMLSLREDAVMTRHLCKGQTNV